MLEKKSFTDTHTPYLYDLIVLIVWNIEFTLEQTNASLQASTTVLGILAI
jgi:hypothetical protein